MGLSVPTLPLAGRRPGRGHRVVLGGGLNSQGLNWTALGLEKVSKQGLCLTTLGPQYPERASSWPEPAAASGRV